MLEFFCPAAHSHLMLTAGIVPYVVTVLRAREIDSAAQIAARAMRYPAATVKTIGGPSPAFAANRCAAGHRHRGRTEPGAKRHV